MKGDGLVTLKVSPVRHNDLRQRFKAGNFLIDSQYGLARLRHSLSIYNEYARIYSNNMGLMTIIQAKGVRRGIQQNKISVSQYRSFL